MKVQCFVAESMKDIDTQINEARANGLTPTLGIAFASVNFGIAPLSEALGKYDDIAFLGASTDGEIIANGEGQVVYEGTAALSLIDCDKDAFRLQFFQGNGKKSFDVGQEVGNWGVKQFVRPGFIVASGGLHADGEEILKGIISVAGPETPVFGGLAGDDKAFKTTFAFTNGQYTADGVVALVLDTDRIELDGIAISGWSGIGAEKRVTKAEGNVVYTIDNEPALEVYKKYLSITDKDLPQIGVEYPLMLIREDGSSILRAVMDIDRNTGALVFAGTVPQGSRVRFSTSSGVDVIEQVKRDIDTYSKKFPQADHLILFSCMARHLALGPMVDEEILAAYEKWNVPLIGFFTYGEIGKSLTGKCDFFNETFTLATLKEKVKQL
jgi:hypothetical protein